MKKKSNKRQVKNRTSQAKRGHVYQAQVDFRTPFKLLQYITLVWDDYEKEVNRDNPGASRRKDFRYPPVIPIIYYELIRVHDYSTKELVEKGNELSLIMLINQMRSSEDFARLKEIPGEYFQNIEKKSSREILQILSRVIMLLLRRLNVPMEEIQTVTDRIWKGETEMLFDSFVGYDIQEVRKTSKAEGKKEGRKEGRIETEIQMIRKMLGKGYTAEQIADLLEREETYISRISRLHSQYPNDDNTQFMEKYYSKE